MKLQLTIDPTNHHTNLTKNEIVKACGVLPLWAANPFLLSTPLQQAFEAQYPFPMPPLENGTITLDGVFQYPCAQPFISCCNTPNLHPLVKLERGLETLFIYPYAIIAILKADGSTFISRMD